MPADTPILGLKQYDGAEDMDFNDINNDNTQLDSLPPTVCTSGTRPVTNLYTGRFIWETDTSRLYMWNGAAWMLQSDNPNGAWVDFSPQVYQNMQTTPTAISRTVNFARYKIYGKTVHAMADVNINANSANSCGIDLPFTARSRQFMGVSGLIGTAGTTPADQIGVAFPSTDRTKLIIIAWTGGFRDCQTNNIWRYSVTYEMV